MNYNLFFSSNNSFAQHLCVSIFSLLENTPVWNFVDIHIIDFSISLANKQLIDQYLSKFINKRIRYIEPDTNFLDWFSTKHYSIETYARLMIPFICDYDHCIYADCDTIFQGNIFEAYNYYNDDISIWAVLEPIWVKHYQYILNIDARKGYFNWWLLLLNLKKIRREKTFEKVASYLQENKDNILFADQDWLNAIFCDDRYQLPPKYNVMITTSLSRDYKDTLYSYEEYNDCKKNPVMIHFNWDLKPRKWNCFYNGNLQYQRIIGNQSWRNYEYKIKIIYYLLYFIKKHIVNKLPKRLYVFIVKLWRWNSILW